MKTDQLISALVADRPADGYTLDRRLRLALLAGGLISLGLFWIFLRPRPDLVPALATWRFDFKILLMMLTAVLAFGFCRAMARPIASPHHARRLLLPAAALLAAIAVELLTIPSALWATRLVGSNSLVCLSAIPFLSLAPLTAVLAILRRGAPRSPALCGVAAGALAAACGATLYAFHCFDDSPLFVLTWYGLAAAIVISIGAIAGHRLLRW